MKQRIEAILRQYRKKRIAAAENIKSSAVLVPLFYHEGQWHILFTRRSDEVNFHKGQVCFPGGTYQSGDASLLQTALRESEEEIGLRAEDVEILGELDDTITVTSGYIISPFVAVIPYPYPFEVNHIEIKQILSIPLAVLMDKANLYQGQGFQTSESETIPMYYYRYGKHTVWGATARIVKHFIELLNAGSETLY